MSSLVALTLPLLLLPAMAGVFTLFAQLLGAEAGYLLGFGFYWLFWCLLVPRWLLGKQEFGAILRDRAPLFSFTPNPSPNGRGENARRTNRIEYGAALLWLLVTLVAVLMYAGEFIRAPLALILLSIPLATLNGFCEEILWRGLYVRLFPHNPRLAILYPSVGFAVWHLAPQTIFPAENVPAFVLSTFFLALPYGYIAYRTGSAKWTALSHSLSSILALSGYLAPSTMALLSS